MDCSIHNSRNSFGCKEEIREICDKNEVDEFLIPMFDMPDPKKYLDQIASILLPPNATVPEGNVSETLRVHTY